MVTSGEQLMVVDGQSQQIVIEQGGISFQGQQIQQTQVFFEMYSANIHRNITDFISLSICKIGSYISLISGFYFIKISLVYI